MVISPFKSDCIKGRVCLITGGGSGIGFGIAKTLGEHGCKLVLMGRRKTYLNDACAKLKSIGVEAIGFSGDVRNEADADAAVALTEKTFGHMDMLVNCAAGNFLSLAEDMSMNAFRTVMEIDTFGVFNLSRASFPALKRAGNGVIINISATLHYSASWYQSQACAAKAAIDSLTRQLALEWGTYGIRVNGIAPGPIDNTPGLAKLAGAQEDAKKAVMERVPMARFGTVEDIGFTSLFLCTDAGSYVSGDTIIVDGGAWLWTPPPVPRDQVAQISHSVEDKSRSFKAKL